MPSDNREQLAFDLASQLYSPEEICQRHTQSPRQIKHLLANAGFRRMVKDYQQDWNSTEGADRRITARSRMVEEEALLPIHAIIHDKQASNSDRISAFKAIQTSSGTSNRRPPADADTKGGPANGIQVNIHLTGSTPTHKSMVFDQVPANAQIEE